jgi:hypothetical protein
VKDRRHFDLAEHDAVDLPQRLGPTPAGIAVRLVEVELREVGRIEIAHWRQSRSRSWETIAVLSVPRPSLPLSRAYPGRIRRTRNGLSALAFGHPDRSPSTLNVGTGLTSPLSASDPIASVSIRPSTAVATREEMRTWLPLASLHRRAARFVTVPMAP